MAKTEGFKALSRQLNKLGAAAGGKVLRSAAMSASLPILRAAQTNAPVNDRDYLKRTYKGRLVAPGFLKRNIARKAILSKDKRFVKVMIGPKPEAFYGTQFIEVGTSKIPARPWLRPAIESKRSEAVRRLGEQLKKNILKAAKRK